MKKILFPILALAAALTACSKSDVIDAPNIDNPITFETYSGRVPVSKATEESNNTIGETGVKIYAYNTTTDGTGIYDQAFMDEIIVKSDNNWTYKDKDKNTAYYWPSDASYIEFYAYSNIEGVNYVAPSASNSNATITYNIPTKVLDQKDLVVAAPVRQNSGNVTLDLQHILAKVGFSLANSLGDGELEITNITISGEFYPSVTASMTAGETGKVEPTSSGDKTASFAFIGTDEKYTSVAGKNGIYANIANATEDNRYMMIAPSGVISSIDIEYTLVGADTKNAKINLPAEFKFESGKAYEFKLKVSNSKIGFDVTVGDWTDYTTGDGLTYPLA